MKRFFLFTIILIIQGCGLKKSDKPNPGSVEPAIEPIETNQLEKDINSLIVGKNATIGISIVDFFQKEHVAINGNKRLPMQSMFKFHLAATVLHMVDQGEFDVNQEVEVTKEHLDNTLWSVIRQKFPEGAKLSLKEIIKYTVATSDNVGCDLLLDMIGGPQVVQEFMAEIGIDEIAVKDYERIIQSDWNIQYDNWTTAVEATKALAKLYENKTNILSEKSHSLLWDVMKQSWFRDLSMKTYLPEGTVIAHKTGSSGRNSEDVVGAQNDIGIVFLPNGTHFYLSILISDSTESNEVNNKLIADVTKLAYDYFNNRQM